MNRPAPDETTALSYCTYCPKLCRHTCPVSNAQPRETLIPQQKMASMRLLQLGQLPTGEESAEALYGCTGCAACSDFCRHGVEPGRHLMTGRAEAQARGDGHPALADLVERTRAHGERAAERAREVVAAERVQADAELALLPGCDDPEAAAATLALCDRLAVPIALADAPVACGGYPLWAGGFPEAFRLHAEELAQRLAGHRRVVVACPACAWSMRTLYPEFGVPLPSRVEILTPPELLAAHEGALPARVTDGAEAMFYHDPCYLGRRLGVYDPPRALLARAGVPVREFSRARQESECSGGGGVLPLTMPETADAISAARLREVHEAGATRIVTGCPTCKRRLTRDGVMARDLVEVLEEATR